MGIYIHIPFCSSKCRYCDFFSRVVNNPETKQAYVDALCREIVLNKNYLESKKLSTIYFGGGTPSIITISQLQQIFKTISENFILSSDNEITLEANPDDLTKDFLQNLKNSTPINRLSIGVQSFFDDDLAFMNRKHSAQQAIDSIKNAQKVGFENITLDLIFSLPEMTKQRLIDNLKIFFDLNVQHLSAYNLIIEEGTIFGLWKKKGKLKELDDESSLNLYKLLIEKMEEKGYRHYEISNFAKPGNIAKHNFAYWAGESYLGIGTSAHSFNQKSRQWNIANINKYIESIQNSKIPAEMEVLSEIDRYNEFILTGLRTYLGISKKRLENDFSNFYLQIKNLINQFQTKELLVEKNEHYILTKKGKFVSDAIMSDLMILE